MPSVRLCGLFFAVLASLFVLSANAESMETGVLTTNISVRSEPALSGATVCRLKSGAKGRVAERSSDSRWLKLDFSENNCIGWVPQRALNLSEENNTGNAVAVPVKSPQQAGLHDPPPPLPATRQVFEREKQLESDAERTLAVLDITSDELDAPTLKKLNERVSVILKKEAGTVVVTQAELLKLEEFGDESKRMDCMGNSSCMVELSDYIRSELIFNGKVGRVGAIWTISLQILDARKGLAAARVSLETPERGGLIELGDNAVRKLLKEWGYQAESLSLNIGDLGTNPKIAVMDFSAMGVEKSLATNLTDVLTVELKQFKGFQVISRQEIGTMLDFEAVRQGAGCDEEGCFAEIGNALGVNILVTGTIGLVEDTYLINLKLIDIRNARIVGREQENFTGPADGLLPAVRFCLRRVLNAPYEGEGFLKVTANEEKADIRLNGEHLGRTPDLNLPPSLPSGKYRLEAEKKNYYPLSQDVYVEPARQTPVQLQLLQRPTPWWKSWWFWTLSGTLVAGAVTTGVVLATMPGDNPDSGSGSVKIPSTK